MSKPGRCWAWGYMWRRSFEISMAAEPESVRLMRAEVLAWYHELAAR